jgi:hypothetical protein
MPFTSRLNGGGEGRPFFDARERMIDLQDKEKRGRLLKAVKTSREAMQPFRRVRKELVRDYVGSWYSETGARNKTLVNLMNQTARIYTIALAANNPQVLVTTPREMNVPFARRFEVNLNHLISDMNLEQTFRAIVLDAFFCMGCGVVMMRDTDTRFHGLLESEEDVWLDPGEPWLNRVPLDELILDMSARELTKMRYCGHRYRADFEKVKDEPGYDKKVKAKLTPTRRGQSETEGSARDVQAGEGWVEDDDLKDMIWLQDIWIAENNTVATLAVDQAELPPLIEREWTGSQAGPYKFLSLGDVPDNIIPASPAVNLKGMHDLQNRLHRRMEDDSDAHRTVNAYPPSGSEDAEKIRTAKRNSWVRVGDPSSINQIEVGGIDQRDMALATFIQGEYDRFAGNLQAMGGLGPQSSTVGQEELIHGAVSRNEADMRIATVNFASECILDLGRLMWEDQTLEMQTSIPVGNTGISVSADWTPDIRSGEFEDYDFKVEPYSMVFKTPEQKLQELFQVLQQIAPLWPMFQASGATLDAEAIVDEIARLKNRPEFKRFITFATPAGMLGGDENTAGGSSHTSRENIRRNIPTGGTAEARSSAMIQSLMGGRSQVNGQTAAAMGRSPA